MKLAFKILLTSALTFTCAVTAAEAQTLKKIRIGYPSLSFRQSNVWVAKEAGLFNKYGLEVEPIFLRGGQIATQALARRGSAYRQLRHRRAGELDGF